MLNQESLRKPRDYPTVPSLKYKEGQTIFNMPVMKSDMRMH